MKQIKEFTANDKFISLLVYKYPLGNCGGITDTVKSIYIPFETGNHKFNEIDKDLIFVPEQRATNYFALKPLMQPTDLIGPMAGGNLAYSSDSRCQVVYHIHDRFETQQTYDGLSK